MPEPILTKKRFDCLARELFGSVLEPHGFTSEFSKRCTFTRQISADIYHVVMPDPFLRTHIYDINVFPTSPKIQESFNDRFPDELGFTLDIYGKLSESGIGMDQQLFHCKYESIMRDAFGSVVANQLIEYAIPFLDSITTYEEMAPLLRGPFSR